MKRVNLFPLVTAALLLFCLPAAAETTVVRDGDVSLSREELAHRVDGWTGQMRESALADPGDRLELINMEVVNKKLALAGAEIVAADPQLRLQLQSVVERFQRDILLRHHRDNMDYPDFSKLAREQYDLNPRKYALIPERRMSSHILFASPVGQPRDEVLAQAAEVLEQLRAGADFEEAVAEYSEEPGAAEKKGKVDRWMKLGEKGISPPYSEGLFNIGAVGEYSDLVQTQFGVHIIRLDGIQEESFKPFEEVAAEIEKQLRDEYTGLEMKAFVTRFNMTDEVEIDQAAIDEILAPYQQAE
ncbi:hypothetical protein DWB85_00610 [Seongchinamella sediminis]|uniref:peptidylprolyl isomerase n=1 Tax=Seongchinamella sediminis TaxID=2283635 RepID=A0A3L7E507_9GAMM|nr:peptidylprolyl isomerase [Seongchinamella sediminis]RLQ23691.1 hypothetical protein DWB85_00610 [Seongchinamella sediminis]